MLTFFIFLLLFAGLAAIAFSVGLFWLLMGEGREDGRSPEPGFLSLSQAFSRELEDKRLWRALSSWMSAKPLRLQDRRDPNSV